MNHEAVMNSSCPQSTETPLNLENNEAMMKLLCPPSSDIPNHSLVSTNELTDDKDNSFVLDSLNSGKDQNIVTASESSDAEGELNEQKSIYCVQRLTSIDSCIRKKKRKSSSPQKQCVYSSNNFVCND